MNILQRLRFALTGCDYVVAVDFDGEKTTLPVWWIGSRAVVFRWSTFERSSVRLLPGGGVQSRLGVVQKWRPLTPQMVAHYLEA